MDRRAVERSGAEVLVDCRVRGCTEAVVIYDISTDGCMLQASNGFCQPGDDVELTFGGLMLQGRVIWTKHRNAGLQFHGRVPAATIAEILADGTSPQATVPPNVELPPTVRRINLAIYATLGLFSVVLLLFTR